MITVLAYIVLENFTQDWSGWLLVLPVLTDLVITTRINGRSNGG